MKKGPAWRVLGAIGFIFKHVGFPRVAILAGPEAYFVTGFGHCGEEAVGVGDMKGTQGLG